MSNNVNGLTYDQVQKLRSMSDSEVDKIYKANEETQEAREPYRIVVSKNATFDDGMRTAITTTKLFCATVNDYLKPAFDDYIGCSLVTIPGFVDPGNQWHDPVSGLYLYFTVLPQETYKNAGPNSHFAFKVTDIKEKVFLDKLTRMSSPKRTAKDLNIDITQDGMDVLGTILQHNGDKFKKDEWDKYYLPQTRQNETVIRVSPIDLPKLMKYIYGFKDEEGGNLEYSITPVRPLTLDNTSFANNTTNYILQIMQAKEAALLRAADNAGMMVKDTGFPMYRVSR